MAPHVKSKMRTLRHKYKVEKKVRQHHRKVRRANKHKPEVRKIKSKDPGIPNLWPFKQQMLEAMERKKAQEAEARKAAQELRREALQNARASGADPNLAEVIADATVRAQAFETREGTGEERETNDKPSDAPGHSNGASIDNSRRTFMKEFKKVVDSSDIILEVLDARDPLGCRCYEAERSVVSTSGGSKRVVLVLNKVDMVPKEVTDKWLAYLRNDFPTVAFRASTQEGRGKGQARISALAASSLNTSECLGAENLLSLLKNYCRNKDLKTSIAVGVIGYPNVGKSSLINSLKRSRAVNTGATPGVTRNAQEVHLDKNIRLIDCPGIVFSSNQEDALVLRNCIKIEALYDPISPVETIIKRVGPEPLMVAYNVPAFHSTAEFLACLCSTRGKFRSGGIFDVEAAARIVLRDWNAGNIPFYTLPPKGPSRAQLASSVVQEWGKEFDMKALEEKEKSGFAALVIPPETRARFATAEAIPDGDAMLIDDDDADVGRNGEDNGEDEQPSYHVAQISSGKTSVKK